VPYLRILLPQKQYKNAKTMQRKRKKFAINTNNYVTIKTAFYISLNIIDFIFNHIIFYSSNFSLHV